MNTYENTEHNVNMLVERQEEVDDGFPDSDYRWCILEALNIDDNTYDDNAEMIDEVIKENYNCDINNTIKKIKEKIYEKNNS